MAGKKKIFNVIDLFSGVGGFSKGFEQAGFNIVSAVEFNKSIANTYTKNHPNVKMFSQDIINIDIKKLSQNKKIDIIIGGPPCQGFSMSGRRIRGNGKFIDDDRNQLFYQFYKIVKNLNPKVFVIENVQGILNLENGKIKNEIFNLFNSIGYDLKVKVLKASDYGVPQQRKRAFFIGNNLKINPDLFYPKKITTYKNSYVSISDAIMDLPVLNNGEGEFETQYTKKPISEYQKARRKKSNILYNHIASSHDERIIKLLEMIKPGQGRNDLPKNLRTKSIHSGSFGRMELNKQSYTITTRFDTPSVGRVVHPLQNRAITAREAARLQSFDDDFIFYGSRGSIGIQIGNAVPPILAKCIGEQINEILIKKHLNKEIKNNNFQLKLL